MCRRYQLLNMIPHVAQFIKMLPTIYEDQLLDDVVKYEPLIYNCLTSNDNTKYENHNGSDQKNGNDKAAKLLYIDDLCTFPVIVNTHRCLKLQKTSQKTPSIAKQMPWWVVYPHKILHVHREIINFCGVLLNINQQYYPLVIEQCFRNMDTNVLKQIYKIQYGPKATKTLKYIAIGQTEYMINRITSDICWIMIGDKCFDQSCKKTHWQIKIEQHMCPTC